MVDATIREAARSDAGAADNFAICCSDGDTAFATSKAEVMETLDEMRAMRRSLHSADEYEFAVEVFDSDYEYAGLWTCDECDEELIVESKLGVAAHVFACANEEADFSDD